MNNKKSEVNDFQYNLQSKILFDNECMNVITKKYLEFRSGLISLPKMEA